MRAPDFQALFESAPGLYLVLTPALTIVAVSDAYLKATMTKGMVTEMVMPEMSGRELAERLKPSRPDMKVLVMSGYTDKAMLHHGELDPGMAFLQKPFTPQTLASKVREVLDAPTKGIA
jgi:FixJ family two-component response regulator